MSLNVKICGITNQTDADVAVHAGADALGFIFYTKSPRHIPPSSAAAIIRTLPPFVLSVGVFVNEEAQTVRETMDHCGLSFAQLHGDESADYCESLGRPVLKAIRLRDRSSLLSLGEFRGRAGVRGFVVDAFSESAYGGTGTMVDWELAAEVARAAPMLLAGGLTCENVADAIRHVQPYGVDVSSGVESSPGKKDAAKVQGFIQAARLV